VQQKLVLTRSNHDKVSASKLGSLSTQLPFIGTLSVIPFSKRTTNCGLF